MIIHVGSENPVKIAAAESVFAQFIEKSIIAGLGVESGVPSQPWGEAQTRLGAHNRAKAALALGADVGVGFEGGVVDTEHGLMSCAWCCVVDAQGGLGFGGGVYLVLPPEIEAVLRKGVELGDAMDSLVNERNTKQREGAVGILTDGLVNRQAAYEMILAMALAPLRRPDLYRKEEGR